MYGLLVCGYQIDDKDMDIFLCLIFEYLDQDNEDTPTGIVYIALSPMFHGLKLAPLMLCILSRLLVGFCLLQHHQLMKIESVPTISTC